MAGNIIGQLFRVTTFGESHGLALGCIVDGVPPGINVIPIRSDLFRDLPKVQYDLIVTNPPYVDAEDMSDLPNEYRHEPELGLASGTDGLKLTRRILGNAADYLADDGVLICEVGNSMVHLMEQYPDVPFTWLEFDNGGDGVFMLTKEQLIAAREHFAIYKD